MSHVHAESIDRIKSITWFGMLCNLGLSIGKIFAGVFGHSQAVVADGVHSLSDLATDIAILIGVRYWGEPADKEHPYGHARIETVVTMSIGIALFAVAIFIALEAVFTLRERHAEPPTSIAFYASLISIIVKEWLFRITRKVGREIHSEAVAANAWHHRSDVFSSIPALVAVSTARFFPTWAFVDHVGAAIVAILVLQAAWKIIHPAFQQLTDLGAKPEVVDEISHITRETPGVRSVHALRTRYMGNGIIIDLHVTVDSHISVRAGHDVAKDVENRLMSDGPNIIDVVVHIEPHEESPES